MKKKKKQKKSIYRHPYHIVTVSPWPILMSINLLGLVLGGVLYLHFFKNGGISLLWSLALIIICLRGWWSDIIFEATFEAIHSIYVQRGLRYGMLLFIVSEIMFFFAFFWAFFHSSLSPAIQIGAVWPPLGISVFNPWEIPLLNTLLLLFSGANATVAHHLIRNGIKNAEQDRQVYETFSLAIFFGFIFTLFQVYEYIIASFSISDGIYGSVFYLATGFHGLHVLMGTIFLIIIFRRYCAGHFGGPGLLVSAKTKQIPFNFFQRRHFFGVDAAIWYWHFVDIVWSFLFVSIYWWGS